MYRIKSKTANKYITIKTNSPNSQCILYELNHAMLQTFQLNPIDGQYVQLLQPSNK